MDRLPLYRRPLQRVRVEGSRFPAGSARWHGGFLTRWLAVAPRRPDRAVIRLCSKKARHEQASIDVLLRCEAILRPFLAIISRQTSSSHSESIYTFPWKKSH